MRVLLSSISAMLWGFSDDIADTGAEVITFAIRPAMASDNILPQMKHDLSPGPRLFIPNKGMPAEETG